MKLINTKLKRNVSLILGSVFFMVVALILLVSPISKYLIQKYDVKYTGREITLEYAYVNPFTGYLYFHNVQIREAQSDSLFLSVKGLSANVEVLKLFSGSYEISQITLDEPHGIVNRNKGAMNFDDVIKRFSRDSTAIVKPPVHFSILQVAVINGEFIFRENQIPINYAVKKVNLLCSGFKWNADTVSGTISLKAGRKLGDLKGSFSINYKNMSYSFAAIAQKFDLEIIDQYLNQLANYGTFRAYIDANINAKGNFKSGEDVIIKGLVSVHDMHFGKDSTEDYAAFDKLIVDIAELGPKNHKYLIDSIVLVHPYFNYERYDYLDNFETMFGKKGANVKKVKNDPGEFNLIIEVLRYVKVLVKNFLRSSYQVNKLEIRDGNLRYEDYTLAEKFSLSASPFYIRADSVNRNQKRVHLQLKSGVKPYGNVLVNLSINPGDSADFDLHYQVGKLPVSVMNPYLIKYTSYPMDRGTVEVNGDWHVRDGMIRSTNHVLVIDPRLSGRVRNQNSHWLPLRLVMYFVRERNNVIDYQIPISGNLKDPKFHYRDVIVDAFENAFAKPATAVYRAEVKENENEIEEALSLRWNFLQENLFPAQVKFLEDLAELLKQDKNLSVTVMPQPYAEKEKEYLLFFNAKKRYFLSENKRPGALVNGEDSLVINEMSNKDSSFVHYIDQQVSDPMLFTLQDKCLTLLHPAFIESEYERLCANRRGNFLFYFAEARNNGQLKLNGNSRKIPYNGYSIYRLVYKGTIPEALRHANEKMNEMNRVDPRRKFSKLRKSSSSN